MRPSEARAEMSQILDQAGPLVLPCLTDETIDTIAERLETLSAIAITDNTPADAEALGTSLLEWWLAARIGLVMDNSMNLIGRYLDHNVIRDIASKHPGWVAEPSDCSCGEQLEFTLRNPIGLAVNRAKMDIQLLSPVHAPVFLPPSTAIFHDFLETFHVTLPRLSVQIPVSSQDDVYQVPVRRLER